MLTFHRKWEVIANATSNDLPPLGEFVYTPEWAELQQTAEETLSIFMERGKLQED